MSQEKHNINISKKLIILIIAIIIAIVIFICWRILNNTSNINISDNEDYKVPITNIYNAIQNKDLEIYLKTYPEFMQVSSMITAEDLNNYYDQYKNECGENITMTYEIGESEACSEEKLQEIENEINTLYRTNVDFTEAYKVNVKTTYTGDANSIERNTEHTVVKYNDQWYSL